MKKKKPEIIKPPLGIRVREDYLQYEYPLRPVDVFMAPTEPKAPKTPKKKK